MSYVKNNLTAVTRIPCIEEKNNLICDLNMAA